MRYVWWTLVFLYVLRIVTGLVELAVMSPGFWNRTAAACRYLAERIGLAGMFAELQYTAMVRTSEEIGNG